MEMSHVVQTLARARLFSNVDIPYKPKARAIVSLAICWFSDRVSCHLGMVRARPQGGRLFIGKIGVQRKGGSARRRVK